MGLEDLIRRRKDLARPASDEQQAFVDGAISAEAGTTHVLHAKAGTGKTWTLVRAAAGLKGQVLMLVFNAKNREELKGRAPSSCAVHTFHSFSGEVCRARGLSTDPNYKKIWTYLKDPKNAVPQQAQYAASVGVSLAKNLGLGLLPVDDVNAFWERIFSEYDIRVPKRVSRTAVVEAAKRAFAWSIADNSSLDFDDMLYFACHKALPNGFAYDYVFLDEVQDASGAQLALMDRLREANPNVVFLCAGDPSQAIYGFRGAGVGSFDTLSTRYGATQYPLTVTRRCPTSVVAEAARIVPEIRAAEGAPEGCVIVCAPADFIPHEVERGAAVLCRNNAPLLEAALRCVEADVPCVLLGKDMAKAISFQTESAFRSGRWRLDDPAAFDGLRSMRQSELADKPFALSAAMEEIDCAVTLHDYLVRSGEVPRELAGMTESIGILCDRLFADDPKNGAVLFSTVHRAKGMEWDTVYCLRPEKIPSKSSVKAGGWHLEQELNLLYVMITRAKTNLVYVTDLEDPVGNILKVVEDAKRAERHRLSMLRKAGVKV